MVEQTFAQVEQVAVPRAVMEDVEQRRRAASLDQRAKRVVDRRLVQALAQPAHLLRRGLEPRHVLRLFEAGQELDLAELHRLESACGRELGAEREEVLG